MMEKKLMGPGPFSLKRGLAPSGSQIFIRTKRGLLARFANNGVHQNGFQDLVFYTLKVSTKAGPIYVESNDVSEKGIKVAVRHLKAKFRGGQALFFQKGPGPFWGKRGDSEVKEHFPLNLKKAPEMAAKAIEKAVALIRSEQASANGYFSAFERSFYFKDARSRESFYPSTAVRFGVTVTKGAGKGYHSVYQPDFKSLEVEPVVEKAMGIAEQAARSEVTLKPGEYECIFHPRAFLELIEPLRRHFNQALAKDRKSVFSGLLGNKIFSDVFSLEEYASGNQFGIPFDSEGRPRRSVPLIEKGVLKNFLGLGHSTQGWMEDPYYPLNLTVAKGNLSFEQMIKRIRRGIFINKIWYHTLVRESEMEVTGLGTAGTLYIEKGKIVGRAVKLRYHDSLFSILKSVTAATKERILLKDGEFGAALLPYLSISRLRVV